jgi:uncharacterized RDD family membrane protein YckC
VARWTGSWLAGPAAAGEGAPPSAYPGETLGFPETGPGSIARLGRRFVQQLLDIVLSWLVADAFFPRYIEGVRSPKPWASILVYVVECVVLLVLGGQTAGMRIMGLRVVKLDGRPAGVPAAIARTALTLVLIPALFFDRDLRGLHDRAVGAAVVRTRA